MAFYKRYRKRFGPPIVSRPRRGARNPYRNYFRTVFRKGARSNISRKVYKFVRTCEIDAVVKDLIVVGTGGTQGPYNNSFAFSLNMLPNFAEFQAIYDQYKITCVDVILRSKGTNNLTNQTSTVNHESPTYMFVRDFDDDTPLTSTDSYLQYQDLKFCDLRKNYRIRVYPRIATMVYDGAITTAYAPSTKATWLDLANVDVPHYGLKYGSGSTQYTLNNQQELGWQVFLKFYISFKEVR